MPHQQQPLVSIVIPVYNGERFVADAIRSALAQTYANKEVIIIDDGSTDGTLDVLNSFGDTIRWETGPNRGGCAARNRGIEIARGELIQFLDSDDLLHPQKLERQIPEVVARRVDVVCTAWEICTFDGDMISPRVEMVQHDDPVIAMLRGGLIVQSPLHWKANLKRVGGFDESLPCSQERDLHLRLACEGLSFASIPDVAVTVRSRPDSVSSDGRKILRLRGKLVDKVCDILRSRDGLTPERRFAIARMLTNEARQLIGRGEKELGQEFLLKARKLDEQGFRSSYQGIARILLPIAGPIGTDRLIGLKRCVLGRAHPRAAR